MTSQDRGGRITEQRNPRSENLGAMSSRQIVELMNAEDAGIAAVVASQCASIAAAVDGITARLRRGGRLVYVGAGTSGRLGVLDAAECPPTFGIPAHRVLGLLAGGPAALLHAEEGAEDSADEARRQLDEHRIAAADAVVGISASGRTPYTIEAVSAARLRGAYVVGVACVACSPLLACVDQAIALEVGPEVLTGSTRLKAGTATKMVLNMLSTGAMVQTGRTTGNLMTHLQPNCDKLQWRAREVLRELTGLSAAGAKRCLAHHGGEVKTAAVGFLRNLEPAAARDLLQRHEQDLTAALESSQPPRGARRIWHLVGEAAWLEGLGHLEHRADSLATEGFLHFSSPEQVRATARRFYQGQPNFLGLEVLVDRLGSALVYEESRGHGVFPHLYAPLPRAAVVAVHPLRWSEAGTLLLPAWTGTAALG